MTRNPILPPRFFAMALILTLALHVAAPVIVVVRFPFALMGVIPIAFGIAVNIQADKLFKSRQTTVKPFERPSVLLREGPFAWSRHPMYLGMTAILSGISLLCGSLSSLLGPIGFWLIIRLRFIPSEERSMMETFGDRYKEYCGRVRSWI